MKKGIYSSLLLAGALVSTNAVSTPVCTNTSSQADLQSGSCTCPKNTQLRREYDTNGKPIGLTCKKCPTGSTRETLDPWYGECTCTDSSAEINTEWTACVKACPIGAYRDQSGTCKCQTGSYLTTPDAAFCSPRCTANWTSTTSDGKYCLGKKLTDKQCKENGDGSACIHVAALPCVEKATTHAILNGVCIACHPSLTSDLQGSACVPCSTRSTHEIYNDRCVPKCTADEIRDNRGKCVPCSKSSKHEIYNGRCVPKCASNQKRNSQGVCVTTQKQLKR